MTQTDAYQAAVKQILNEHRAYIDSLGQDLKSIQLTVSVSRDGKLHYVFSPQTQGVLIQNGAISRYAFST